MADPANIASATITWDPDTMSLEELARVHLTSVAGLDRLNAPAGIRISELQPGDNVIVPVDLPVNTPFAESFWIAYGQVLTNNDNKPRLDLLTPLDWLQSPQIRLQMIPLVSPEEAQFMDRLGNDTRLPGGPTTPISVQPGVSNLPPAASFSLINDPDTTALRAGEVTLASEAPSGSAPSTDTSTSLGGIPGDVNGDGVLSAADSPDIFGPNGSIGAPPGWAWAFDPTVGDFTIRKLDPVGDPSRLDEWIWQPGPDFDPANPSATAGAWTRVASQEINDPLAQVPAPVRPFLQAVLNGEMTTAQITDPIAQQWVRFTLRGITDDSLRRGAQPEQLPFGTVAPQAAPAAPTLTVDQLSPSQRELLTPFGIGPASTPEDIARALAIIGSIPREDLAVRLQGGSLGGTRTQTQIAQGLPGPNVIEQPGAGGAPDQQAPPPTTGAALPTPAPAAAPLPPAPMRVTDGLVDDNTLLPAPPPPSQLPPPRPVVQPFPQPGVPGLPPGV